MKVLITGITGQDGSFLAEHLLAKGHEVHGVIRRVAAENYNQRLSRINHIKKKLVLHTGSIENYQSLFEIINKVKPNQIYHLAAQSFVKISFQDEFSTMNSNIQGTHNILSIIKTLNLKTKFYFAASSEMFGLNAFKNQNENTKFNPSSVYAISKVTGFELTKHYRDAHGIFACSGILFNHESPRRGFEFVTRKITSTAAKIKLGLARSITLGNLNAKRDWGYSKEYVEAMVKMLSQNKPEDFVIGTGKAYSVREFLEKTFKYLDLDYRKYLKIDKKLFRKTEVDFLLADPRKAKKKLKWKSKTNIDQLIKIMVDSDLDYYKKNH